MRPHHVLLLPIHLESGDQMSERFLYNFHSCLLLDVFSFLAVFNSHEIALFYDFSLSTSPAFSTFAIVVDLIFYVDVPIEGKQIIRRVFVFFLAVLKLC
jgi:hypothetical protein